MNSLIAWDEEEELGQDNMTAIMVRLLNVQSEKRGSNNSAGEKK